MKAKPFRELVGEFTRLMTELDAICERDPILRKRITAISRAQLEELIVGKRDQKHSSSLMLAFMQQAITAIEQREREVLYADRSAEGSPQRKDHGITSRLSHARGSR